MKLFLVICLVATALAAPAEKVKRTILPGDARYDAKDHGTHTVDETHKNEVEIAKALGTGFAGAFSGLDETFGFPGFESGDYFGNTNLLKLDVEANKALVDSGSYKVDEPKKEDDTVVVEKPDETAEPAVAAPDVSDDTVSTDAASADVVPSKTADKEEVKDVETKSDSEKTASSDTSKTESAKIEAKSAVKGKSAGTSDSAATPFFDSTFGSDFASLGYSGFSPITRTFDGFTSGFDTFNPAYEHYFASHPLSINAYSSLNHGFNVPYLPPSSFGPVVSVAQSSQPLLKINSEHSFSAPALGHTAFHSSFHPEISGISQLTDANGGYVY